MEAGGSSHIKDRQGRTPLHQIIRQMGSDEAQAAKVASVKLEAKRSKQAEDEKREKEEAEKEAAAASAPSDGAMEEKEGKTKEGEKATSEKGKPKEKDLGIRGKVVEVVAEKVTAPSPLWNIVAMLVGAGKVSLRGSS